MMPAFALALVLFAQASPPPVVTPSESQRQAVIKLLTAGKPPWECAGDDPEWKWLDNLRYATLAVSPGKDVLLIEAGEGCARGRSNGAMWLLRFDGNVPTVIAGPEQGFSGYVYTVRPPASHNYRDIIVGWHMGADEAALAYFRFDGKTYRRIDSATLRRDEVKVTVTRNDEAAWSEYLDWLKGRAVGDLAGLDSYRKVLVEQGTPTEEVKRRMALISERALKRPEAMRLWFNSMYGPEGAHGPDWPTPFLMEVVKDLKPGAALDVCMGEGRNSIFLADLGWRVTGFDVSDVAVTNTLAKAKKAGVQMAAIGSGYQDFDFGHERWDLIVMTHAYFPIRDTNYVDRLIASMRRGGLLVFQHGVLKPGADQTGDAALLGIPEEGELKDIFRKLRIVRYEEVEELSDWQVGEGGRKGRSVKMLAQKP